MMKFAAHAAMLVFCVAGALPAQAALTGTTIETRFTASGFGTYAGPVSSAVPATLSPFPGISSSGTFGITFTNTSITLLSAGGETGFSSGFDFNGAVFSVVAGVANIGNVTIDPTSTLGGFTSTRLTFTSGVINVDLGGLDFFNNDRLVLNVGDASAAVPEPVTWAMMLVGFGALGCAMRSERRPLRLV